MLNNLLITFTARQNTWLPALGQHIQLSLSALLLATIIAVPLGIVLSGQKRPAEAVLQLSGIMQTIPSLALLGLMIPFFGIGAVPALIALIVYALFPILQGTLTGLQEIPPELHEAAEALGLNRREKLKTYELALAMPVITAGIRTAAVMIIGTATLAALIGAGGLGTFILLGIDRSNDALILIGAVTSALLAVLFSYAIHTLERRSLRTVLLTLGIVSLGLVISFVPLIPKHDKIVIAGKLGPEPEILINMYGELIRKNTDLEVELKPNFGKTTFLYEALKVGTIDIYPEFTGTVTASLLKTPPSVTNDARLVYEAARDGIKAQDNLAYLEPAAYENTYAIAVPRIYAAANQLQTISDLAAVEKTAQAGFTLEFNDRDDGNRGLVSLYGLNLRVNTMEPALRYQAIAQGTIQITDAYSTDSELKQYDLVVLADDKHLFPPYQGAPLMRQETLDNHPELQAALEKLAGRMTAEEMRAMNYDVRVNGRSAHDVAVEYLKRHHLI
ncbi:ABC transporter permease/substrate-binding protein [Megasphaera vaginalis (ex Srinivasan et al. 2021)]|uniref:ABC transporter, quaternary amine uptake transporter family, substrate-binding protein n=1 Tax=Megasphaera vaginalis (ex Srinivasan et al. 2021) TaxID=1111454 RepID=U7UT61_9FIRM|nr:ABC transporter permease/substrate-binding protein [Megasphaera vaginalis (ex Srinivasan et al. 2021)]ERT62491.1 ABC transporter, quaternary amine uptake transporter family, substrate-binding protein [Megasphaera vaginalis (ex Srinivasan et al. 2021)]